MRMAEINTNVNNQEVSAEQAQQIVQQVLGTLLPGLTNTIGGIVNSATQLIPTGEKVASLVPTVSCTNTDGVLNLSINGNTLLNLELDSLINAATPPEQPTPPDDTPPAE